MAGGKPIFGRAAELYELEQALDRADGGSSVLIDGDPGIGKSTLWSEWIGRAEGDSVILRARAVEAESRFAYCGLTELLEDAGDDVFRDLPASQSEALAVALLRAEPASSPDARLVSTATLGVFRHLAAQRRVLVAIDDLQWLDAPTAMVVSFALRRLKPGERVSLFGTIRRGAGIPVPLAAVMDGAHRLTLPPLSFEATAAVLANATDRRLTRQKARQIWTTSGGNPLHALELARASLREPETGARPMAVSPELHALMAARLQELPPSAQHVLLVAALLTDPRRPVVERAVDDDCAVVDLALASQMLHERMGRLEFAHPLFAAAVQRLASDETRRAVHLRLASLVGHPEQRAMHLSRGSSGPDGAVADALEQAATSAFSRGAPTAAAEFAEEALERTLDDDRPARAERAALAGRFRLLIGDQERGIQLLERALAYSEHPRRQAEILLQLAEGVSHDLVRASAALEDAVRLADGDPVVLTRALGLRAALLGVLRMEDLAGAERQTAEALAYAEEVGNPNLLLQTLAYRSWVVAMRGGDPTTVVERASELEPSLDQWPLFWLPERTLLFWRMRRGEHARVRDRLMALHRKSMELGQEEAVSVYAFHLADLETAAGRWARAQAYADQLTEFAEWTPPARPVANSAQARLAAYRGDAARAKALSESGIEIAVRMGSLLFEIQNRAALALAAASEGDHEAVLSAAAPAWERLPKAEPLDPAMLPFLPEYGEALVAVGDHANASGVLTWLEEHAQRTQHPWGLLVAARLRGVLRAAQGDLDGAEAAFAKAESRRYGIVLPPEDARTLLERGIVLKRANRRAAARAALEQAHATFEQLGAEGFARRSRNELARIGGRVRSEGLTPAQRQVAELAASGLSNREIAKTLYVSENTVESHMRNIFRSLGVKSRVQLTRHLAPLDARERST